MLPPRAHDALIAYIERPLEFLAGRAAVRPPSVHGARKQLKRARASLRVLRDAVGARAYRDENRRLRDAARPLAATREADVMIGMLSELVEEEAFLPYRSALAGLRAELRRDRAAFASIVPVERIRQSLEECRSKVSRWRMPRDCSFITRSGLERIYRRGRKAMARAREQPTDARLHELRKQVKYLGAALQALGPVLRPHAAKIVERADVTAELLGTDHDFAVLRRRVAGADRGLLRLIGKRREALQAEALPQARKLFRRKPAAFISHILQP
jgi:CHAD domain-containing protein